MSGQIVYGQALYETGEFDEARQVFERALTLDPENLIALRSLGDMSLQSGNTAEARRWYLRLLDADPKDMAVIALVTEIDASAEAAPVPTPQAIPGVDADAGDQAIPFIADLEVAPVASESTPSSTIESVPSAASESALRAAIESAPPAPPAASEAPEPTPPDVPEVSRGPASVSEPIAATAPAPPSSGGPDAAPPPGLERHYPVEPFDASMPDVGMGAEGLHGGRQDEQMGAEGLRGTEPESPEPIGTEGLAGKPPVLPLAGAKGSRSDDEDALDTWTPPPDVAAPARAEPRVPERVESRAPERVESRAPERVESRPERAESRKEEGTSSGPGPEPFVNETMAQLYLQQGYRQLALRVYYQLAESRPNDQALKDRIAEIEAADHAAHPEMAEAAPVDRAPVVATAPPLSRHREPPEAPARAAPRADPESVGARQPSVREFFATLGRRRPPRSAGNSGGGSRTSNNARAEAGPSIGSAAPGASLDEVFAGATVSPADSRAASRLAGAFSGSAGTSRTSPPTPPMPTPRVNPRIPQAQESEEDVAKFRAWLDGLTGE
jgi:tetratricopeptide (TPR) repeat protein